jgi:hypothetical protein
METKRYYIIIASLIFALLAWLAVNLREDYTIVKVLPVTIENLKSGTALKYPVPKNVAITFRGKGLALAGLYLVPQVQYNIDVSSVGRDDFYLTKANLPEHVTLPTALQMQDISPDTITLALDAFDEKKVSVSPRIVLDYREGYGQVGPIRLSPDSILISGSKTALLTINSWPTAYKKFDDIKSPINYMLPLEESEYYSVELTENAARLQIDVQPFAEKTFTGIPVRVTGVPVNREVVLIPPKMDIIVRGGIEQLARLQENDFQLLMNYELLPQDSVVLVSPTLTSPPEVKIVSKKPEKFQFIIRKKL